LLGYRGTWSFPRLTLFIPHHLHRNHTFVTMKRPNHLTELLKAFGNQEVFESIEELNKVTDEAIPSLALLWRLSLSSHLHLT
jgi:hypothetical protein